MDLDIVNIKNIIEENNYVFIETYISNIGRRVILQDNIGYKYDILFSHFKKGHRGFLVVSTYNPFSIDNMRLWLHNNKENIVLYDASNYVNNLSKIVFLCTRCNRKFNDSWSSVKGKIACPECMKGIIGDKNKTHGQSGSKLYRAWVRMMARCYNKNDPHHLKYYINKGIVVCGEWKKYENFYNWAMSNGYEDGLTIERMDSTKNYDPNNCCWIESKLQNRNRTNNSSLTINGETKTFTEWQNVTGVKENTIRMRIKYGHSGEDLIYKGNLRSRK